MEYEARLKAAISDRYQIEREIGSGGMATVYLAQDLKHDRKVAVKVLDPDLARTLGAERFLREIRTAANLTHPHILPVFDSGEAEGFLFYVMPYVKGESLRARLAREKQLPVEDAVQITREIADALAYAHREGVIHRDLKPANVMLEEGHAVLADFGVAHAVAEAKDERITRTGTSLGTPTYMSPEQAAGEQDLDGRSDQYALGCVLYEMLTGHPPFAGAQVEAVLRQHLTAKPPSVARERPSVPQEVVEVIHRSLAKSPADRFRTTGEMAAALALTTKPQRQSRPTRSRPALILVAVTVVVTLAGLGLWRWMNPGPLGLGDTAQLTFDPGLEIDPALSPDGNWLAYSSGSWGAMHIHLRQVSGGGAVDLTSGLSGDHRWPQWSPDGTQILFQANGRIFVTPALGGAPRTVVDNPDWVSEVGYEPGGASWSPDGSQIAFAVSDTIFLMAADGSGIKPLAVDYQPHSIRWSPDGAHLLYVSGNRVYVLGSHSLANGAASALHMVSVPDGAVVSLTDQVRLYQSPVWLPSGDRILYISDEGGARDIYEVVLTSSGRPSGSPFRLTTNLGALTLSLSADGQRLVYSRLQNSANIWSIPIPLQGPLRTSEAEAITTGTQAIEGIGVSPDGRWLAFDSNRRGNFDVYRMALPDGESEQLTTDPANDLGPSWSPDGEEIAFYSFRHGSRDLFVMTNEGASETRITDDPNHESQPDWSPDGNSLTFVWDKPGSRDVWVISRTDPSSEWGEPRRLTQGGTGGGGWPAWSPDGLWIAYTANGGVHIMSPDGGFERTLVRDDEGVFEEPPSNPEWSSDSRTIYFRAREAHQGWSFWAVPVSGGAVRLLLEFDDPTMQSLRTEYATDGERFFFTIGTQESDLWVVDVISG